MAIKFAIEKKLDGARGRAGTITTKHGEIQTPAFCVVGTKATVKSLSPEEVKELGVQVVLANTYHLYLQPGVDLIKKAGGFAKFMNWNGPTVTDSGGFQVFSLGAAYGKGIGKILKEEDKGNNPEEKDAPTLAKVTDEGVSFKSHIDGSEHFFTPESSMDIQHALGADIMFAFDECTSPHAPYEYQKKSLVRTHEWARRCIDAHDKNKEARENQGLFGVVQGGRFPDLRKESASFFAELPFSGFGIGGSFEKKDITEVVGFVNDILPEEKPRHLLGIGEPEDLFSGIEEGVDLFDCVAPTRIARNGQLYTKDGKINILNARFKEDFLPIDKGCECACCSTYSRAYLAHLFRAHELFGMRLASIHNVYFIVSLVSKIRDSILDSTFYEYKKEFLGRYAKENG